MKYYKRIPFNRIKDIASYIEKKLKAGHIIIQITVNEDEKEIDELVSYANDKECKSYFCNLADTNEQLRTSVIEEVLAPYYAYKDDNKSSSEHYADIDIENDNQCIYSFQNVKKDFTCMEKSSYEGVSFLNEEDEMMHYEFYISTGKGDIANFGGSMELDFITEWMTENGYYSK